MRLLNTIRSSRPKRTEATTDDSQRSASSWRNTLKLLHRSRQGATALAVKKQQEELHCLQLAEEDDKATDSDADVFQTLMSNSVTGPPLPASNSAVAILSSNNRSSMQFWHTNDPNFLPTAYPLTRTDPRSHPQAKWGSLNLAASAALVEGSLKRFSSVSDKHPRFRFGPRPPLGAENDDRSSRDDSTVTSRSRSAIEICTPKYAYIAQDGKLVEREVRNWPRPKEPQLSLRYKLAEPYATNYGKKSVRRARSLSQKVLLPRHRWIYERPIFMVPRAVVNENKRRLMARHMLKDRLEPPHAFPLPSSVSLQESEQCKRYLEYQTAKCVRETEERIAHVEKMRKRTDTPLSQA